MIFDLNYIETYVNSRHRCGGEPQLESRGKLRSAEHDGSQRLLVPGLNGEAPRDDV